MDPRHLDRDPLLVRCEPPVDRHDAEHEAQRQDVRRQRLQHQGEELQQDPGVDVRELVHRVHRDPGVRDEQQRPDGEDERQAELAQDVEVDLQKAGAEGSVPGLQFR